MTRTPLNNDWAEQRAIGRREADRGVCSHHDACYEVISGMRINCIDHMQLNKEEFNKMEDSILAVARVKLDGWIFKLFVGTMISIAIAIGVLAVPQLFRLTETITVIYVNQQHLMEEFSIKPVK